MKLKYRILDCSGLAFANMTGIKNGIILEYTGYIHPLSKQMIFIQPILRGVVMMDRDKVEFVPQNESWCFRP